MHGDSADCPQKIRPMLSRRRASPPQRRASPPQRRPSPPRDARLPTGAARLPPGDDRLRPGDALPPPGETRLRSDSPNGPSFQRERNCDRHLLIKSDPSPFLAPLAPSRRFGDPSLRLRARAVAGNLSSCCCACAIAGIRCERTLHAPFSRRSRVSRSSSAVPVQAPRYASSHFRPTAHPPNRAPELGRRSWPRRASRYRCRLRSVVATMWR